ncbi:MAG: carboxylate-amine ligase [Gammaproteobacteria bacterium]|jgi:carboxylate-amine ligase
MPDHDFTVGIEEEYLLVDPASRDLLRAMPSGLLEDCQREIGPQVCAEFLQCQIEVGTPVCNNFAQAKSELAHLRTQVARIAEAHGAQLIAASTHPFATWSALKRTAKERYQVIEDDLQAVARRMMISGMHVHVGIIDDEVRIDLLGQVTYILPHLLALSTSSPFWQGQLTGLKSYRIAVWDEMPRTGLPEAFSSHAEFVRHVDILVKAGIIQDGTKLWWDVRPSMRYPTLEMRISDVCTSIDDAICVAALYRCWLHMLVRLRSENQRWRRYSAMLINENRWRAQRYGIDQGLVDFGRGAIVPYADLLDEILALIQSDAQALDCVNEVEHARTIVERGTSAHRQIARYQSARDEGADDTEALRAVVDSLVEETLVGST